MGLPDRFRGPHVVVLRTEAVKKENAMKFKSAVYTQASGSIGGITYSHNIGGMYARARATPKNPNSTFQQTVRAAIAQLTSFWLTGLNDAQRTGWATYASNVVVLDRLGESRYITGLNHFVRSNVPRIQADVGIVGTAPTVYNLGDVTQPTATIQTGGATLELAFNSGDEWTGEVGSVMLISLSNQQNPTKMFFKGPYRYVTSIAGAVSPAPTSPAVVTCRETVAADNKVFLMVRVSRVDGRLSLPFLLGSTWE